MSDAPVRLRLLSLEGREAPGLYLVGMLTVGPGGAALAAGVLGAGVAMATAGLLGLGIAGLALAGASALQRRADTPTWGWRGPGPIAIFLAKVLALIFFFMWVRWTVPRFRYDQVMEIGWKKLLPLAIANLLAYAVGIALIQS